MSTIKIGSAYDAVEDTDRDLPFVGIICPHCKEEPGYLFQGIISGDREIIVVATCGACGHSIKLTLYIPA
jgi:uncharacterized protein (DUF983 family)